MAIMSKVLSDVHVNPLSITQSSTAVIPQLISERSKLEELQSLIAPAL